jgi:hypothetical protein
MVYPRVFYFFLARGLAHALWLLVAAARRGRE